MGCSEEQDFAILTVDTAVCVPCLVSQSCLIVSDCGRLFLTVDTAVCVPCLVTQSCLTVADCV